MSTLIGLYRTDKRPGHARVLDSGVLTFAQRAFAEAQQLEEQEDAEA